MKPIKRQYSMQIRFLIRTSLIGVCFWVLLALNIGSSLAQQSIEERCRIKDPPTWSQASELIPLFKTSDLPAVKKLAHDIQETLKTYESSKQIVPALQNDCHSLIMEGIALKRLEMSLAAEGGDYNRQCYNQPKNMQCTQWLERLLATKSKISQKRGHFEQQKAAYYRQRQVYDHAVEQLTAKLKLKLGLACQKECQHLKAALAEKRSQVQGLQEALRRLDRSQKTTQAELADWGKTAEKASEAGWQRGKDLLIDNLGDVIGVLSGDLEKWGGKDAVDVLETRLKDPELKKVVKDLKEVKKAVDDLTWTSDQLEPTWEQAYSNMTDALGNPKVQQLLKIGGHYAKYASYLKSIVDSSYDISAEIFAWLRIRQADHTNEGYLKAVDSLHERMVDRVTDLNAIKSRIQDLDGQCTPCEQNQSLSS